MIGGRAQSEEFSLAPLNANLRICAAASIRVHLAESVALMASQSVNDSKSERSDDETIPKGGVQ